MANVLRTSVATLLSRLQASASEPIVYMRGALSINCNATFGRKLLKLNDGAGGTRIEITDADIVIPSAELVLEGEPIEPERGDRILHESPDVDALYEVLPYGDEPVFRWSDPYRTICRVHAKLIEQSPHMELSSSLLTGSLAWWGLHDAASNNRIDSSGGHTMVLTGSVPSQPGLLGNAANFPGGAGGNYLDAYPFFVTSAPFAMSIFINAGSLASASVPFAQSSSPTVQRQGFRLNTDGSVSFYSTSSALTSATGLVTTGTWHQLLLSHDGTILSGYVDGVLRVSGARGFTVPTDCTLGQAFPTVAGGFPYQGFATLAGMWGRALTDAEIAALYNGGTGLDYPFA